MGCHCLLHPCTYSSVKWDGRTVTVEDASGSVCREVEPLVQRVPTRMRMKTGRAQSRGDTERVSMKAAGNEVFRTSRPMLTTLLLHIPPDRRGKVVGFGA